MSENPGPAFHPAITEGLFKAPITWLYLKISRFSQKKICKTLNNSAYIHREPKLQTPSYRPMMLSNMAANVTVTPQLVLLSSGGILLVYGIYKISTFIYHEMTSTVRDVPGPPSPNFLWGNFKQISESVGWKVLFCEIFVSIIIEQCFLNRVLCCKRIGLANTEQQSNINGCSGLSRSLLTNSKWLI